MFREEGGQAVAKSVVKVPLGDRSYDIAIGAGTLVEAGAIAKSFQSSRCTIVTDETVAHLHLPAVKASLQSADLSFHEIVLPPGEGTKDYTHLVRLCDALLDQNLERGDAVIALGGGVIGDLAGFAASIVKRGMKLIQIPTTLLAQVDSSVGGKTGINTRHGKNLIGTFHQPRSVLIDIEVLDTLDDRQLRAGYAEIVKYGLIGNTEFFAWLKQNAANVLSGDKTARIYAIEQSCKAKASIVAEDEKESGRRALLNLGHTFGHALETWAGYSGKLLHGEAVAIGMVLASEISEELGYCQPGTSRSVIAHLQSVKLPVSIKDIWDEDDSTAPSAEALTALMAQDKKAKSGKLSFVLLREIGDAFRTDQIDREQLYRFLDERCSL